MNHNLIVYPVSPNITPNLNDLEIVKLDCKPILGSTSNKVTVSVSDTLLQELRVGARMSRLRISEYLSTLINKSYEKESSYQAKCKEMYGGVREKVIPGVGRIDLLTDDTVIEVKCKALWKGALGQVLAYSVSYPNHKRAIALTPDKSPYKRETVEKICSHYGVDVYWL